MLCFVARRWRPATALTCADTIVAQRRAKIDAPAITGEYPARLHVSLIPLVQADAPNVVWAIDFQFDSTVDGKAIKIASMFDEHAWVSRATERRPNTLRTHHPVACELKALRCVCSRAADTGTANRGCWHLSNAMITRWGSGKEPCFGSSRHKGSPRDHRYRPLPGIHRPRRNRPL
jgi:hypothetical protein